MKIDMNKKILLLGIILLIIAGVVVIALKGLNVSLLFRKHESISLIIGQEINFDEIKNIFPNKEVKIRKVELFDDSVNISADSFTDEEKEALVNLINDKYNEDYVVSEITVRTIPNIRIRDVIRPYIKPVIVSGILIIAYMMIKYRKLNLLEIVGKLALSVCLTEAALLSLIAITRIPVSATIINLMVVVVVIELVIYDLKLGKKQKTLDF